MPTLTTSQIADHVGATLRGPGTIRIDRLDTLENARAGSLTFIRTTAYAGKWAASAASAALVSGDVELPGFDAGTKAILVVPDADLALIRVLHLFAPEAWTPPPGAHASAIVDPSARVHASARVGPGCVVGPDAQIDELAVLHAHVVIGAGARVGARTILHPHVAIGDRCRIGRDCILHPGAVIGADGFGYRPAPDGRGVIKIPHVGDVVVGDHVEIGANSCIDRAKLGSTVIGEGTKIDNLVQIAHNCQIGRGCLIAGQSGIAGSTIIGDGCVFGGQASVVDNTTIGPGSRIAANSCVTGPLPGNDTYFGYPAIRMVQMRRVIAATHKLPELIVRLRELEKRAGIRRSHRPDGETP
jgi:UDP-3-O-[3-hydroxymyristoyl] glucosamine N-acyltransferase